MDPETGYRPAWVKCGAELRQRTCLSKALYFDCYARWSHTVAQRARLRAVLSNRLTPSATRALHHSLSRRDTCAGWECKDLYARHDAAGRTAQY